MSDQAIYCIGLNHKTAGVEVREKFALTDCADPLTPEEPFGIPVRGRGQSRDEASPVTEAVVLSTCNRVEIVAVGGPETPDYVLAHWAEARSRDPEELAPYVYRHQGMEAVRHVFEVAASLDSLVVGEPQILGQLKTAYKEAVKRQTTKVVLNRLMHKAFSVAKRVRTQTAIGGSAVSISFAAVELAKRIFGDMEDYTAMLIGAGEMAELAATHLLGAGLGNILVANRTLSRAQELAARYDNRQGVSAQALGFDQLFERLAEADIVISSTGATEAIIRARDIKDVLKRRKNRPMFFIDIAVPRDIDPDVNNLDNIYLYDIDDLKEVVEENLAQRQGEALKARGIVEEECEAFSRWLKALEITPTIKDLLAQGEDLARAELDRTMKRLGDVDPETRKSLEVLVTSLVGKLLHEPIGFLRRRAEEEAATHYIDVTRRMFNLDNDPDRPEAHPERRGRTDGSTDAPAPGRAGAGADDEQREGAGQGDA